MSYYLKSTCPMRALPLNIGTIHFVGIGGIGMSGIAEVLHMLGYRVQGSDIAENANVQRLRQAGIEIHIGHDAVNLGDAQVVVTSTAVKKDNPEVVAARAKLIPVVRRAEMLAELMRLRWSVAIGGTHGKTTTTSLVACVLEHAKLDPTVINGGIIEAYGTNTRMGSGDWMVVEADESDGSFLRLPAVIAVITNMDPEHLDHWGTEEAMQAGYDQFVSNIPFYGFAVLCVDHPQVQQMIPRLSDHRIITYGFSPQADVRAEKVVMDKRGATFEVVVTNRAHNRTRRAGPFRLPMLGHHNVLNSLAAIAVALEMEISDSVIASGLASFKGVKRRFTRTGEYNGVAIIDDYGHHPVEIAAVLKAARQAGAKNVIAVVQPHRYSRLKGLFGEFCTCMNDADTVIVADVYAAGESPIEDADRDALVEGLRDRGHRSVVPLPSPELLPEMINAIAKPGDYVVCLGAGTITQWAQTLPHDLEALNAKKPTTESAV
ncbi:UDP-N-acetylmuramate--L-alanine ligase [Gluconobacter frateurii M-2]|nr:UDP-N-acetylmuramate--L-alanine ligase [Gluconobacter frateurii M-2]